jgi:(S)-mandelate dehydrogenase
MYLEIRKRARRGMPRDLFDFIDGGADDEVTLRRNERAFDDLALVPRVLRGVSRPATDIDVFKSRLSMPIIAGPAGASLAAGPNAYAAAALGAWDAGTAAAIGSFNLPDEFFASARGPKWVQLYLGPNDEANLALIRRAISCEVDVLLVTVDAPVPGNRRRDTRNRLQIPPRRSMPQRLFDHLRRPTWAANFYQKPTYPPTVPLGLGAKPQRTSLKDALKSSGLLANLSWDDLSRVRDRWHGALVIKGVLAPEDASTAVEKGFDGIVVSNHGGRQLDTAPAAIEMLPDVVAAVDRRIPVLVDGGIRRGTDVIKALCLGATACLIARPWLFAVAIDGRGGVRQVLTELRAELATGMQLMGVETLAELNDSYLRHRNR